MINAKASFDKTGKIQFEKQKWRCPVASLTKVVIQEQGEKFNLTILTDKDK